MPLIIAVLIIIVVAVCVKDTHKESQRQEREYSAAARKTDAETERGLVDYYMKHGNSFAEAYRMAQSEMIQKGFDPCIPKDAYRPRGWHPSDDKSGVARPETSYCSKCSQYDSQAVKSLRNDYKTRCEKSGETWTKEGERAYVYGDRLPTSASQYSDYLRRQLTTHQHDAVRVGRYISYKGLGTCEVVDLDFEHATQTIKVMSTGEIRKVPFGDKNITVL